MEEEIRRSRRTGIAFLESFHCWSCEYTVDTCLCGLFHGPASRQVSLHCQVSDRGEGANRVRAEGDRESYLCKPANQLRIREDHKRCSSFGKARHAESCICGTKL